MQKWRLISLMAWLSLSIQPAVPQESKPVVVWAITEWVHVQKDKRVKVKTSDQVSDGCWRDPQASKTAVELEFIRSGFTLDEKATSTVSLTAIGYKTKGVGICVVSYYLTFSVLDIDEAYAEGRRLVAITLDKSLFFQGGVMTGGPQDSSERLKTTFVELTQSLLVHYTKQIQEIKTAIEAHDSKTEAAFWLNWMNTPKSQ